MIQLQQNIDRAFSGLPLLTRLASIERGFALFVSEETFERAWSMRQEGLVYGGRQYGVRDGRPFLMLSREGWKALEQVR